MKFAHALTTIALLSMLGWQPAQADDSSSAMSSEQSSELPNAMSSEPLSDEAKDNYESLIAALETPELAVDLATITEATSVDFLPVSSLETNGDYTDLDSALEKNKLAVDQLQADIAANAALSAMITAAGYAAEDVIAIVVAREGTASIFVYVDDRS